MFESRLHGSRDQLPSHITGSLPPLQRGFDLATSETMGAQPVYKPLLLAATGLVLAFLIDRFLFVGVDAPPSDHGSGSMFDLIATRYDMINRVLALGMDVGWRKRMVNVIQDSVSSVGSPKILDIATGTADVALLLSKTIERATIVGVDPSNNMLEIGRQKIQKQELNNKINLRLADARDFSSLEEASFDAATMAFGIRNVPEKEHALCQIHRVLKTGSRFCILEFSEPDDSFGIMGKGARLFIRNVIPFLGGVLSGAPREYWHLQNSIKDFPSPQVFGKIIESVECSASHGSFKLEEIIQMNYGSVQLYVATVVREDLTDDKTS